MRFLLLAILGAGGQASADPQAPGVRDTRPMLEQEQRQQSLELEAEQRRHREQAVDAPLIQQRELERRLDQQKAGCNGGVGRRSAGRGADQAVGTPNGPRQPFL